MRWIVALVALGAAAWFLRDGQRRARVQDTLRNAMPAGRTAPGGDGDHPAIVDGNDTPQLARGTGLVAV